MIQQVNDSNRPYRLGFLLLDNYTLLAFSSAIEVLRMANQISNRNLYEWTIYTLDGQPVKASCGLEVTPQGSITEGCPVDTLFLCSGIEVRNVWDKHLKFLLRKFAARHFTIGALCTASYLLARAGLLDGYRCTIHWENMASVREEYPNVILSEKLFEIDRDRITCAGGSAPMDLMLEIVKRQHGNIIAEAVSEQFLCERIRSDVDRQRMPLKLHLGTSQPKLVEAVTLMEANIEEPMGLGELAQHVGVSRRQMERLFQKYLNCVPTRYYLELRLQRARLLLLQTDKSIVDVALACGFVSAPHFSKCYRDLFGIPPRDERRLHRNQQNPPNK